jgi:LPXTG-site transpeptidase (sortase) family protein
MESANEIIEESPKPTIGKRRLLGRALIVIGVLLLVFGSWGLWQRYHATHSTQPLPSPHSVSHSSDTTDETPIATNSKYEVPATQPRSISLPTIGAEGFIQKVGIDKQNRVAVPGNINMAGWFTGSSKPGEAGVSLVDGHVQGKYAPGIFKNLGKLKKGDVFSVEFGDRSAKRFRVLSVTSYPVDQVQPQMLKQQDGITVQLNLITCDGPFDRASQEYSKRILVVSQGI